MEEEEEDNTPTESIPNYDELSSKPPSYNTVRHNDRSNWFNEYMATPAPKIVTLGVSFLFPAWFSIGSLRICTMIYLHAEILMMHQFTRVFKVSKLTSYPNSQLCVFPKVTEIDPLPLLHLVLTAIWCPVSSLTLLLLTHNIVLGYRLSIQILYFCFIVEVFTTVVQRINQVNQILASAINQEDLQAELILRQSLTIRSLFLPVHVLGMWFVFWLNKLLP